MSVKVKRWYRSRRNQFIIFIILILCIIYYISLHDSLQREPDLDLTRRSSVIMYIEKKLEEALREDKGTGCEIPQLDPFAKEVTQFDKTFPKIKCPGKDWVRCYLSECKVVEEILSTTSDILCTYQDIIYHNDFKYKLGPPTEVSGDDIYTLDRSDHVKIKCVGTHHNSLLHSKWTGYAVGFRKSVERRPSPPDRNDTPNVLIFGFDSTSKNGFIRRMPKSYQYIMRHLEGTLLEGYNIVGDGTPAALFPILTGKTELELPDVRKATKSNETLDSMPFLFYKLKEIGYRTAYFEDMPWIGTFQYRFKGFLKQPADHYLRAFYLEESNNGKKFWGRNKYCVGDTPQYQLMMNITEQFFKLDGKKFCFTFIADITHDNFNMISSADEAFVEFLKGLRERGVFEDTMLFIMGDHGARYAYIRDTLQGKLEERLPLMYVQLPTGGGAGAGAGRARRVLAGNARALSTPHDVHASLLHALRLPPARAPAVRGADLPRALSLLQPIPLNRSCSEAGIEPHWCACLAWKNVSQDENIYWRTAQAFVDHINKLTEPMRSRCVPRTLLSIKWVMRQMANKRLLTFSAAKDADGYTGNFKAHVEIAKTNYQVKVVVSPGDGCFEAVVTHYVKEDKFVIDNRDISRINRYGQEPSCVSASHPHLNKFCYCKEYLN
ncbi:uncharacterized protein LOC113505498 [Trichoplusia ni]|uniref:Uncharacterized protein LOC113505498 n=1 Tax=Trichoplusia ni TaxID=7111 RepID=A0A7E5WU17_TRINI|nr:uncharacterized protein LOC113505498 [Trichoplusia ni]